MFTFLLTLWILPIALSNWYSKKHLLKNPFSFIVFHLFFHDVLINILCCQITGKSILNYLSPDIFFYIYFVMVSILILPLSHIFYKKLYEKNGIPLFRTCTFICGCLLSFCFVYFGWLLGESGRLSFEVFLYNIQNPINTEVANFATQMFGLGCFLSALIFSLWYLIYKSSLFVKLKLHMLKSITIKRTVHGIILPVASIMLVLWYPYYSFHLDDAYTYLYASNPFIQEHYVDPHTVTLTWPQEQRNLLYIFIESFESSSFSKELGGMRKINLLPNITEHMKDGISFSDKAQGYGGGMSMPQATVTLSGLSAYLGGVNYKLPLGMEKNEYANVLPQLTTLTDLLYEQGYQGHMMIGMRADGYSIGPFFRAHGNTEVKGSLEVKAKGLLPEDYEVWWGFEDSKLLQFAKDDLQQIAQSNQPFVYSIITNNTHRVNGYTEDVCNIREDLTFPMEHAIYCEDQLISEFLTWLKQQSFYENTTVVIVGDHLGHDEAYTDTLQPQADRRIFNLILNPAKPYSQPVYPNRQFWSADFFPTVLSSMGVDIEGDRLGLGTNLFSDKMTIIEEYGYEFVSNQLAQRSKFYTDTFLRLEE